ncbi:hypothetical protein J2S70_001077 [Trueperella bonasi]|uniref:SipW-cognate class signal peptide n=1 Tax=Trueperella bonasi TaxID=312286 RepID=A0ABT9NGG4_9ACTO|nr:hypothetical protein [Trueperella bonasi]MDP9806495.1 hypothetical protein [Trueperella bonasi]
MSHGLKQRIALALSIVLALVLAGVAVVAGVAVYSMGSGKSRYAAGDYGHSSRSYGIGTRVIPERFDSWEAYFGQGTAEIRADAVDAGMQTLTVALELVPKDEDLDEPMPANVEEPEDFTPECRVRMNLAIGHEIQGDRLFEAGYFIEAQATYMTASDTVAQCVPQGQNAEQQKQDTDGKAQEASEQNQLGEGQSQGGDSPGGEDPPDGPNGDEPKPSTGELKAKELERRAQEAERLRREAQQRDGTYGDWKGENW